MKIQLLILSLGLFSIGISQKNLEKLSQPTRDGQKTVYYTVVSDNPEETRLAKIAIPLWYLSGSKINSSLYNVCPSVFFQQGKFQGVAKYNLSLFDHVGPESLEFQDYPNQPLVFSVNKVNKAQEFSLSGSYFFKGFSSTKTARISLKSEGKVNYVTDIPATFYKKLGVTLGYAQGFTWYNLNNTNLNAELYDERGVVKEYNLASMSTMQTYSMLKLGLVLSRSYDITGDFEGYGQRTASGSLVTHFNLMYAFKNTFDDVYVPLTFDPNNPNNVMVTKAIMDAHNDKVPFGFEFGQRYLDRNSVVGVEYALKYLPGLSGTTRFSVELGFSINVNFLKNN